MVNKMKTFREWLSESKLNESKEVEIKKVISKIQSKSVKEFAEVFANISRFSGLVPIFVKGKRVLQQKTMILMML